MPELLTLHTLSMKGLSAHEWRPIVFLLSRLVARISTEYHHVLPWHIQSGWQINGSCLFEWEITGHCSVCLMMNIRLFMSVCLSIRTSTCVCFSVSLLACPFCFSIISVSLFISLSVCPYPKAAVHVNFNYSVSRIARLHILHGEASPPQRHNKSGAVTLPYIFTIISHFPTFPL